MSYTLEGPKWNSQVVTWSFATASDGSQFTNTIDSADQAIVRAAIARWQTVTNLTFKEVSDTTAGVDIRIGWGDVKSLGLIGQTSYGYTSGSNPSFTAGMSIAMEDPAETPLTGGTSSNPMWQGTQTSLYQIALHEFGHALGLGLSSDYSSVMYASSGLHNTDLDQSDIAGVDAMYGTPGAQTTVAASAPATSSPSTAAQSSAAGTSTAPITSNTTGTSVYRFLDTTDGTHFFTSNSAEATNIQASRSDMKYEGVGMGAVTASDPNSVAVYRFLDAATGTHFYTASGSEKDSLVANTGSGLSYEGVGFYEHATQQAGDAAVYRFLDTSNGTHFYSSSPAEISSITASRPDLHMEGVAFYAPAN